MKAGRGLRVGVVVVVVEQQICGRKRYEEHISNKNVSVQ